MISFISTQYFGVLGILVSTLYILVYLVSILVSALHIVITDKYYGTLTKREKYTWNIDFVYWVENYFRMWQKREYETHQLRCVWKLTAWESVTAIYADFTIKYQWPIRIECSKKPVIFDFVNGLLGRCFIDELWHLLSL